MKKVLLFLLCLCFCLPLAACGRAPEEPATDTHTHTAAVGYANDDRHHWNPCTVGECHIKLNWQEHNFVEEEVTTLPTEDADGVLTRYCGCGYTKTEPVSFEGVDDMIFDAALFEERFSNVTVHLIGTEQVGDVTLSTDAVLCFDGELLSVAGTVRGEQVSETVTDATLIGDYKTVLFFCRALNAEGLEFDKTTRIYYTDYEPSVRDSQLEIWDYTNVGIKLSDNLITYAVCDYTTSWGEGRTGHMEITLSQYGSTHLQ